jgi:Protein of unknown function (DUF2721)
VPDWPNLELVRHVWRAAGRKNGYDPGVRVSQREFGVGPACLQTGFGMNDIPRLFQAFVAPAIFVSAEALLLLSLNVRLMGMVTRLRAYLHHRHTAAKEGRIAESEAYASQIASIERRAEMIRKAFVSTLYSLLGTVTTCLLLGLGLYWRYAQVVAVALFVISMIGLLAGIFHYVREVGVALSSVREEAADLQFMDLGERMGAAEEKSGPPAI